VPSDAKAGHSPGQQTKAFAAVAFIAVLEQELVAKTNAKYRKTARRSGAHRGVEPAIAQHGRSCRERADAGENNAVTAINLCGVCAHAN
jgi:hypothetical protein